MAHLTTRTDLLEREAETAQIGRGLDAAAAGAGGVIVIDGAAGIGKTALMDEAASLAEARGMVVQSAAQASGARIPRQPCGQGFRGFIEGSVALTDDRGIPANDVRQDD